MLLQILTEPNKILRQVGKKLTLEEIGSKKFKKFIKDLTETMYIRDGVGIAAPQVGESVMFCVIAKDFTPTKEKDLILINPVWEKKSITKLIDEEGCLSVPGIYGLVKRYKKIKVKALDENGKEICFEAENFPARVIQHEIDHLNGILFIDKATKLRQAEKTL
ncbi:MAG TPA: peptide deformylase [Candidatus Magasanikbacteria bacterium]|nr:peptide deformylase [Candidatus Magasanikbacteria bacterium]